MGLCSELSSSSECEWIYESTILRYVVWLGLMGSSGLARLANSLLCRLSGMHEVSRAVASSNRLSATAEAVSELAA